MICRLVCKQEKLFEMKIAVTVALDVTYREGILSQGVCADPFAAPEFESGRLAESKNQMLILSILYSCKVPYLGINTTTARRLRCQHSQLAEAIQMSSFGHVGLMPMLPSEGFHTLSSCSHILHSQSMEPSQAHNSFIWSLQMSRILS